MNRVQLPLIDGQILNRNELINVETITAFFVKLRDLVSWWQKEPS